MTPLYNLSPVLQLALTALLLACIPLAWVCLNPKNRGGQAQHLRALTVLALFLTFDLILIGAFTRLTDSGLGCPDWPGCYGHASPLGAQAHISAAQNALPTGPVTHTKAWIEMVHRYVAMTVGLLILVLTVVSWLQRKQHKLSPWWATATLVWVCVQGAFGALTVTMKLFPAIVTLHLFGGLLLLALLQIQALLYADVPARSLPHSLRWLVAISLVALCVQIALGAWVSSNYAVLACTDFPRCQGQWWPTMDFRTGFTWWRELGSAGTSDGSLMSMQALTAIHYTHRLFAYLVLTLFVILIAALRRLPNVRIHATWLAGLVLAQLLTGVSNAVLGWPLSAALLHTAGAAGLVLVLVQLLFRR